MPNYTSSPLGDRLRSRLKAEVESILRPYGLDMFENLLVSGRLLRSQLLITGADGTRAGETVDVCVAMELLHASTLVHDDVVDEAATRRGHPTISATMGDGAAIFIGNLLAERSNSLACEKGSSIQKLFSVASTAVNSAQLSEFQWRSRLDKSVEQYEEICRGKTSTMFILAGQLALELSSDARPDPELAVERALGHFGLAFQLTDDIEDIERWRHSEGHGSSKSALADIELGNYTAPLLYALRAGQRVPHAPDLRSLDPRAITDDEWETGIAEAKRLRGVFSDRCTERLRASFNPVAQRLAPRVEQVLASMGRESLDGVVSAKY